MRKRSMVACTLLAVGLRVLNVSGEEEANMQDNSGAPMEWTKLDRDKGYVVFSFSTLKNLPPSHVPTPSDVAKKISCALARDEYESIQFGVHAISDGVKDVRIEVESDLEATVFHRIEPGVKEKLVETDMPWVSWVPDEIYLQRGEVVADLPKGSSVNFWLTFRADPEASQGLHTAQVRIQPANRPATILDLELEVRPFELAPARIPFGMYYREDMLLERFGGWAVSEQLELELYGDMAAHSQNSVHFYMAPDFSKLPPRAHPNTVPLEKRVALAAEAGLVHRDIPCVIAQHNIADDCLTEEQRTAAADWLQRQHREDGWPEILIYGWDEPPYPAPGLRESYAPLRTLPIRLTTAMGSEAAYAYGDVHDAWIVLGGEVTSEMRAEASLRGAQVWTYSFRILREGFKPLRQRYYAGLYTWAHRLGGNYVWAYSHGHHGHVWWEPESTEPLPITGWEARREGVDDFCYLQMVEDAVEAMPAEVTAIEAAAWLESLRARLLGFDPHDAEPGKPLEIEEYEEIRARASDYIHRLGPVPADAVQPAPVTYVRDEAAPFRNRSVKECIAGLRSSQASERRSAAWALFEKGPEAAPAVDALAEALEDPEVRIPALRALEGIGPDAYSAAPRVSSLLSHADAYVRLGATFTLSNMARPPSWNEEVKGYLPDDGALSARALVAPLRQALRDRDESVVRLAALGLFLCGEAAAPALPDAMALLGTHKAFGLQVLSGMGPGAVSAVPALVKAYEESEGKENLIARTLAAIGPAASEAVPVLEKYRTPGNRFLADACYALYCIRGGESELVTLGELVGDDTRPRGYAGRSGEWQDAARFLSALGGEAASVVPLVRERLPLLDSEPSLRRYIEQVFFKRVEEGALPLRLLLR